MINSINPNIDIGGAQYIYALAVRSSPLSRRVLVSSELQSSDQPRPSLDAFPGLLSLTLLLDRTFTAWSSLAGCTGLCASCSRTTPRRLTPPSTPRCVHSVTTSSTEPHTDKGRCRTSLMALWITKATTTRLQPPKSTTRRRRRPLTRPTTRRRRWTRPLALCLRCADKVLRPHRSHTRCHTPAAAAVAPPPSPPLLGPNIPLHNVLLDLTRRT